MSDRQNNIWNVPNILTMLRMALIGVFIWQFTIGHRYWAMIIFIIAGITDLLDGYIARKYQLVTSFGKLMDPLADKLMLITALTCLAVARLVPIWVIVIVLLKEIVMVVGGFLLYKRGIVVQAELIGKVATVVFVLAVVATFLHEYTLPVDFFLQILAVILSVSAMIWYVIQIVPVVQKT